MSLLSSTRLSEAVQLYVEKKDANSIQDFVLESLKHLQVDMSKDVRKDSQDIDSLLQRQTAAVAAQERKLMEKKKQFKEANLRESQASRQSMPESAPEEFKEERKSVDQKRKRNLDDLEDMSDGDAVAQVDLTSDRSASEPEDSEPLDDDEEEDVDVKPSRKRAAPAAAKPRQRAKPAPRASPKATPKAKPAPKPRAAPASSARKLTLACTSQGTSQMSQSRASQTSLPSSWGLPKARQKKGG